MPESTDVISAPIALLNLPDVACYQTVQELLAALPSFLVAQIPSSVTNVIISPAQPLDTQRTALWIRTSVSGGFLGFYVFTGGAWTAIFPVPNNILGIFRNPGDSTDPPPGYTRIDDLSGLVIDPATVTALKLTWIPDTTTPGEYVYYQVLFTGF